MCLGPGRKGICGKAGMNHCHLRNIPYILQIVIKRTQLADKHHPFINDCPAGQGANVSVCILFFKHPAQKVQFSVKVNI